MQQYSRESVAYDLGRYEVKEAPPEITEVPSVGIRRKEAPKQHSKVNPVTIAAIIAAAALLAFIVQYNMELTALTVEVSQMRKALETLRAEQDMLEAKIDERMNLSVIEEYATDELGMVKMNRAHVEYIDLSNPDSIQVLTDKNTGSGAYEFLAAGISRVLEYLN